jgi:hypothetical protein
MAASMIIPTLVAITLLAADVLGFGALMASSTSRCCSACSSPLLRLDEYTGHAHGHDVVAA